MSWTYCEQWNQVLKQPLHPFGEGEARRRHGAGELYTAVGQGEDGSTVLVEIRSANGYAATRFLDDKGRDGLVYLFSQQGDRLFLRKIMAHTYGEEAGARGDIALVIESYTYTTDGVVRHKVDDSRHSELAVADYDSVDVSSHWEDNPAFGEYASISRWDRG
ncbi:hypothetical protein [Actinokineospora sp. NBRC 105648]|uniref:hypothetical protein n=1 Tax=Actinokineospora sp. NBRC 105648 TaxID=3032206 RepID=UPI0024A5AFE7|nr:hypothetical protein [Actinokineospora sp. NBRC 105648]GLZ39759.1 hypothetical protein Acsp05_33830 [Actinokineospora sp. NBRC 105648]